MTNTQSLTAEAVEKITHKLGTFGNDECDYEGYTLKVVRDDDPVNPFEEWDHPKSFGIAFPRDKRYIKQHGEECDFDVDGFLERRYNDLKPTWEDRQFENQYYWLPVYKYAHSGVTYNTIGFDCPWDSGLAGIVYIKKAVFATEGMYGVKKSWPAPKRQKLGEQYLKDQIQLLADWASGNVWGFVLEDAEGETLDSCWGFFGDDGRDNAISEVISTLDFELRVPEAS